jgi:hypothetical protein
MARKETQPKRKRRTGVFRVILNYVLLWPSLRNYVMLWFKYKPKKKEKKEKIVIIED